MTTATAEPEVIEQEDATDEAEAQAPADEAAETTVEAGETPDVRDGDDAPQVNAEVNNSAPEPAADDTPAVVATVEKYVGQAVAAAMDQDDERDDPILALQIRVANYAECQSILDHAHKQMKKQHEAAVEELRAMRNRRRSEDMAKSRPLPLIDQAEAEKAAQPEAPVAPAWDPDAWKAEPIDGLIDHKARSTDVQKLKEAEIETMGAFGELGKKHGTRWHRDIPGIGEKAAERIQDAWNAWYTAWEKANKPAPAESHDVPDTVTPPQTFDEDTTIDKILDAPEHEAAINQLRSRGCFTVEQFARFDADPATDWSKIDADAIAALRAAVEHHK